MGGGPAGEGERDGAVIGVGFSVSVVVMICCYCCYLLFVMDVDLHGAVLGELIRDRATKGVWRVAGRVGGGLTRWPNSVS